MKIFLNGNSYTLQAGTQVNRTPLAEWPDNIRLDGQQQRKDRSRLSSWAIDRWANGLGIQRQNVDITSDEYRLWEVENCDTRHPSQIVLSPALNICAITPSRGDLDLAFNFVANLYFAETQSVGTGNRALFGHPRAYKFTPPLAIGSYRVIANSMSSISGVYESGSLSAIQEISGGIAFVDCSGLSTTSGEAFKRNTYFSVGTLGGTTNSLFIGSNTSLGTYPITIFPKIADMGGTVHLITYRGGNTLLNFWCGDKALGSLTCVGTTHSVIGTYLAPLVTDGLTMYAQLPQGVYDFDATPAIAIDTSRAEDKNCAQVLFGTDLYFKNKKSLMKYDGTDVTAKGYDREDGLPFEQMGEITAMCSSWKYIFAAVKGASYSHILAMDEANKWQYYAKIPTYGWWVREMFLSDAPDAIDRLWCIFGNAPNPGYFLNPMINPLQAGTYSYVPTGYFTKPIFDGGMSEERGAFYDEVVTADGIGGNNKITCLYGLNGASPVTSLGVVATTTRALTFASPYGVEGLRIQPKFMLHRASSSGTSPIFREATIHYLKLPKDREAFDFNIDLKQTATKERPLEAVIGSLSSERGKRTLMPFWYGKVGTKAVKVLEMPSLEEIEEDKIYQGNRSGFIRVRVAEIL